MMAIEDLIYEDADTGRASSAVARLLDLGRAKGYVTFEDIYQMVQDENLDLQQFEEIFSALLGAHVTYVE
jgi:hypothetical protein